MEGRGFRDQIESFREKGAVILGISFDTVEENRAFAEKLAFPFELLSDPDRKVGLAYGACDDPAAEYAKRISYLIGPDQKVASVWAKVDPKVHPDEVLRAL